MNESKTNRWQCSCPIKGHENDIHLFYKNYYMYLLFLTSVLKYAQKTG